MILISVVSILVYGMYPSMVKDHIEKKELNLKTSFLFACHKFWSLLGASLLVILILSGISSAIGISLAVLFYTISLDLPIAEAVEISGAIIMMIVFPFIVVFFHYISSAIIMDDLKAVEGFGRSWKVGKKNYLFTLLICLVPVLIGYVIYGLSIGLPFYYLGVEMGDTTFYAVTSLFYRLLIGLPFLGAGIGYIFTLLILTARSIFALIIPYTIFYHFYIFLHFEFTWPTYPGTAISNISILLIPYAIIVLFIGAWTAIIQSYAYYGLRA
jgi:hypothetical protein